VAPVGIGAALGTQEGYPVVLEILPGTPAQLGGQLQKGDRILSLAQGDGAFVDTRNVAMADIVQMVRGTPGSLLQLHVLPANSTPNTLPRIVSIVREQLKFKQ
jgi:carboxyl-terminal processing protease